MEDKQKKLDLVRDSIGSYPDFPKPGILFRDIFGVLRNPKASECLFELILEEVKKLPSIDIVVGLDSRGFLFGPVIALKLGIPFVPVRKRGKLPGKVQQVAFVLEYGQDVLELQEDSIKPGQKILVVDDLLATGGTMEASCKLISQVGGELVGCLAIIELIDLQGRKKLNAPVTSIIQY
ncbi:adenine phosphoribosyltransferase [Nilaparvata lugens]|uniref:adenine phosphoribosyltransferase n=1 Tax=Nilaparvata lugens TaxID=108931 RepID=UPI000B989619|nr:adenine phosphoribosyltransferase [Nilaparvata lugens]